MAPPGNAPRLNAKSAVAITQSAVAISVRGSVPRSDYLMELIVHGGSSPWTTVPSSGLGRGLGGGGVSPFHISVSDAFSSTSSANTGNSGNGNGFGLGNSGLDRSAAFAGNGPATISVTSNGNAAEVLLFSGLVGAPGIRIAFGLNDLAGGGRSLLISFSPLDSVFGAENGVSSTPEPASMLLIGTGLAGLAAVRRRRSATRRSISN
jgi:hypothetical protein